MDPSIFKTEVSPGRLVKTEFHTTRGVDPSSGAGVVSGYAFVPDPLPDLVRLGPGAVELLAPIECAVGALKELNGMFKRAPGGFQVNPWALYRPLRLREARLSSEIENTVATSTEVVLAGIGEAVRPESIEIQNYMKAIEAGAGTELAMTEAGIRELHRLLLEGVPRADQKLPGRYRPSQVYIGDERRGFAKARFVPPPAHEIPMLMSDLVSYMNNPPHGVPELVAVGLAHYQFETIHPFMDGNGRLGRMLITLSMCRRGLIDAPLIYPSGYINERRNEYYDRLFAVSRDGDWLGWLHYFLEVIRTEAAGTLSCMERLLELRQIYIDRLEGRSLSQNILTVIDMLFTDLAITPKSIHERIGGSLATAHNYIGILTGNGTLVEVTGRKKGQVYIAHEIMRIADQQ